MKVLSPWPNTGRSAIIFTAAFHMCHRSTVPIFDEDNTVLYTNFPIAATNDPNARLHLLDVELVEAAIGQRAAELGDELLGVLDVAGAVRSSLERTDLPLHDSFYICASENWTGQESRPLAVRFFPETTQVADSFAGSASFISSGKAKELIGFAPRYSWRDLPF